MFCGSCRVGGSDGGGGVDATTVGGVVVGVVGGELLGELDGCCCCCFCAVGEDAPFGDEVVAVVTVVVEAVEAEGTGGDDDTPEGRGGEVGVEAG